MPIEDLRVHLVWLERVSEPARSSTYTAWITELDAMQDDLHSSKKECQSLREQIIVLNQTLKQRDQIARGKEQISSDALARLAMRFDTTTR